VLSPERAGDNRLAHRDEVGVQERENIHGLGIAHSGVVLEEPDAVRGQHEPAVEDAAIGLPDLFFECPGYGRVDLARGREMLPLQERKAMVFAGVRAHASCVRAGVILPDTLVVLHWDGINHRLAIAERLETELFSVELFFDDDDAL
jgi:hypothetical protein